jgi:hypothetical protein
MTVTAARILKAEFSASALRNILTISLDRATASSSIRTRTKKLNMLRRISLTRGEAATPSGQRMERAVEHTQDGEEGRGRERERVRKLKQEKKANKCRWKNEEIYYYWFSRKESIRLNIPLSYVSLASLASTVSNYEKQFVCKIKIAQDIFSKRKHKQ